MKRYFRIRIMLASLLSFLILMVVAVTGIFLFTYYRMERDTDAFIQNALEKENTQWKEDREDAGSRDIAAFFGYRAEQRRYPSGFYRIWIGTDGTVREDDRFGITEDLDGEILRQVKEAVLSGSLSGKTGSFKYGARLQEDGTTRVILLDISIQLRQLYDTMLSAGPVAAGLFVLLILILLPVSGRIAGIFVRNAEQQRQFITDAGHDLKTPVAIARANLDVLELSQGKSKWSGNIRSQVERLELLVGKLLMLSRLEETEAAARKEKLDLSEILEEVWQDYQLPMQQKEIRGQKDIPPGLTVKAEKETVSRLFRLLMDNAVQYTESRGEIRLQARPGRKRHCVLLENTVEDLPQTGPEQLTERFVRGNTARTQKSGGSGIGLAAVRRIVEIYRGRLRIEYPGDKRFRVTTELPRAA